MKGISSKQSFSLKTQNKIKIMRNCHKYLWLNQRNEITKLVGFLCFAECRRILEKKNLKYFLNITIFQQIHTRKDREELDLNIDVERYSKGKSKRKLKRYLKN